MVASNKDFAFVFMFNLDKNAKVALAQFRERDYYQRYLNSSKKIFFVGVNFAPDAGWINSRTYEVV